MDYKILRFYSQDVEEDSFDFKTHTYYLKEPLKLDEEYTLTLKQFMVDSYEDLYSYLAQSQQYTLKQLYITDADNNNWGATTLGFYRYQDHGRGATLIFEVFKQTATAETKARLIAYNDYDFDIDGFPEFRIYQYFPGDPNPAYLITTGYVEIYNFAKKAWTQDWVWHKTTAFKVTPSGIPEFFIPPYDTRKFKLYIKDVNYDSEQYINSNKDMSKGAMICYLERRKIVQMEMGRKYLLTLAPQTITKITFTIEDENGFGVNNYKIYNQPNDTFDNFTIVLILKKKNPDKKKSLLLLDKR